MAGRPSISIGGGMLEQLPIIVETLKYRKLDPMHWHDYTQIWYVLRGSLKHTLNGKEYIQRPGECAVVLPFTPHTIDGRESPEDTYILSISFADSFLTERGYSFFSYSKQHAHFGCRQIPEYTAFAGDELLRADEIAYSMLNEFSRHHEMSFDKLATFLAELLGLLCTEPSDKVCRIDAVIENSKAITEAIRYMAQNLDRKHSLDELSARACMSRCSFTKYFKSVTGMTSKEFLLTARLLKTSNLLVFTNNTLDEISEEVGFYDSAYLVRAFRESFGVSPMQYREQSRPTALEHDAIFRNSWAWFFDDDEEYGHGISAKGRYR